MSSCDYILYVLFYDKNKDSKEKLNLIARRSLNNHCLHALHFGPEYWMSFFFLALLLEILKL